MAKMGAIGASSHFTSQQLVMICGLCAALLSCAGPTTPFGALHELKPAPTQGPSELQQVEAQAQKPEKSASDFFSPPPTKSQIEFYPTKQVLHDRQTLKVAFRDPRGISDESLWKIYFNGYDVTRQILPTAVTSLDDDRRTLILEFPNLRLRPEVDNLVKVAFFQSKKAPAVVRQWDPPDCSLHEMRGIDQTGDFNVPPHILKNIQAWATEHKINPSLITGLIAQESAFDPTAVSWAKAMGLTQVTPIGDLEIARTEPSWPRSDKVTRLPASLIKTLVNTGQLTARDDWRLNPELSIRGGLTLLEYFENYWRMDLNFERLESNFSNPQQMLTPVVLASYHSGAARVKRAINESGPKFLTADYLKEARKYVNRVNSYCYHFSKQEGAHAKAP